jgi:uridylate kinase
MKYHRVLLKLSGETLAGNGGTGILVPSLQTVAEEIAATRADGAQLAVVIGAGNLWRGAGKEIDRVTADYMGMLATVMNSLALREVLKSRGIPAVVMSAFEVSKLAELYVRDRAVEYLEAGQVVILAGGTGNPYFTTDTTAALRAAEIGAEVVLKATQVDGVYSDDPKKNPKAVRYDQISFDDAIAQRLRIMDMSAFTLCRDNGIAVVVFDFYRKGNLARVLAGEAVGTRVSGKA